MNENQLSQTLGRNPGLPTEPSCKTCPTLGQAEWHCLSDEQAGRLNRAKGCMTYKSWQHIFRQNSACHGLHCILEGTVALRRTDAQGNSSIVRLVECGQTLGHRTYFAGTAYSATAEALTDCRICFIPRRDFQELIDESPALNTRFLQRLAGELGQSENVRFRMTHQRIRTRLAHLILSLRGRHGEVDDDGNIVIQPPLSRRDMAAFIGARAESLSRAIRALREAGVAEFGRREIVVHDLDNLLDEIDHQI